MSEVKSITNSSGIILTAFFWRRTCYHFSCGIYNRDQEDIYVCSYYRH